MISHINQSSKGNAGSDIDSASINTGQPKLLRLALPAAMPFVHVPSVLNLNAAVIKLAKAEIDKGKQPVPYEFKKKAEILLKFSSPMLSAIGNFIVTYPYVGRLAYGYIFLAAVSVFSGYYKENKRNACNAVPSCPQQKLRGVFEYSLRNIANDIGALCVSAGGYRVGEIFLNVLTTVKACLAGEYYKAGAFALFCIGGKANVNLENKNDWEPSRRFQEGIWSLASRPWRALSEEARGVLGNPQIYYSPGLLLYMAQSGAMNNKLAQISQGIAVLVFIGSLAIGLRTVFFKNVKNKPYLASYTGGIGTSMIALATSLNGDAGAGALLFWAGARCLNGFLQYTEFRDKERNKT